MKHCLLLVLHTRRCRTARRAVAVQCRLCTVVVVFCLSIMSETQEVVDVVEVDSEVDVEHLITLVAERPVFWDKSLEEYIPTIKTFTNKQFLDFQVGVLQVVKNIKNQTAPSQVPPNSQWPYQQMYNVQPNFHSGNTALNNYPQPLQSFLNVNTGEQIPHTGYSNNQQHIFNA